MNKSIKNLAKRLLFFIAWDPWLKLTWSQEGEDCILRRYFETYNEVGFYIDIGAHHPYRFSNTMQFYRLGWKGINIDAMPGSMKLFEKIRPRDINIETGVGLNEGMQKYYFFNEPALNGFNENISKDREIEFSEYHIIDSKELIVKPLHKILSQNLSENQKINFMSIDVEGLDLEVLQSNDWIRFRPELVLVERYSSDLEEILKSELNIFMKKNNYVLYAKTVNTIFFRDQFVEFSGMQK